MKYYELLECAKFLQDFRAINSISRVEDNTLRIDFEPKLTLYAALKRGASGLFMCDEFQRGKRYQAPFDITLGKRFSSSFVESLEVSPNDRVLSLKVTQKNSYKMTRSTLLLEFTGKNTNAIILDENDIVAEALRHIDKDISYRVVKVGEKLAELPPFAIKEEPKSIADVRAFLYESYAKTQNDVLQNIKNAKRTALAKKICKLEQLLDGIESKEELEAGAKEAGVRATLLLANRHLLKPYAKECELEEEGKIYKIPLGKGGVQGVIDELFTKSKRLKQRARGVYVERENLTEKLEFLRHLDSLILNANSKEEVEILVPKRKSESKKDEQNSSFSSFFVEGYKVMVGKNEKGNVELLKNAKKNDIWFHVKDAPSSHVILRTDKSNAPESVIGFCAKLCLNFSSVGAGAHEVDYTQRRNVRVSEGAHVNYTDFKTLRVQK